MSVAFITSAQCLAEDLYSSGDQAGSCITVSFRELNVNDSDTKQEFAEQNDLKPPHPIPSSDYFPQTTQTGLLTVIVLCVIFLLSSFHRLNHTDLWGHLCFGRWIVQQEQLPSSEPFAAAPTVEPFTNIPWLAQVLGYLVERSWGAEGLVAAHTILLPTTATGRGAGQPEWLRVKTLGLRCPTGS